MGFFDNLFNGSSDPRRSAQIRGGMLGAANALLQPYSGIGNALTGAGYGAQEAKQNYLQDQFQQMRVDQMQNEAKRSAAQQAALKNLFIGTKGATPGAQVQPGFESAVEPMGTQLPTGPQFKLPPGFDSPEQFQAYAAVDPEGALKRMFPEQQKPISVAAGTRLIDPVTHQEVYSAPERQNPNQPFNSDGSPNKAYQDYEADKLRRTQAPQWANVEIARNKQAMTAKGLIEPETLTFMAQQVLAGDKSPYANIGRGAQGAENLSALRGEVMRQAQARGLTGADLAALNAEFAGLQAGERTLGNRTANIEMAANEARNLMPLALEASKAVPRSKYPSLNAVMNAIAQGTGDENIVTLGVAVNGLINTYARAISPTGTPTVSDKDHARELLDKAWANGQFDAAVAQMDKEIAAAQKSPGQVRGAFRSAISGRDHGSADVPDGPTSPAPKSRMLPRPKTPADAAKLKPGTHFIDGNGVERVR